MDQQHKNTPWGSSTARTRELLTKYPWFTSAMLTAWDGVLSDDPYLKFYFEFHPLPAQKSRDKINDIDTADTLSVEATLPTFNGEDIIDTFLGSTDHRIIPDDEFSDEDIAAEYSEFELPEDDLVTEELAEIYLAQGLKNEAMQIYGRLILLNPKKSVYFAELIKRIATEE